MGIKIYRNTEKPKNRHRLRLAAGKAYFTFRRHLLWRFGGIKFAGAGGGADCVHRHFSHQTPLLRKLKDVDMHLQHNKIVNLRIAVSRLNGVTIMPGETLSYWRMIGRPTRRKGYVAGMVLDKGRVTAGIGGGLCQLSNLIYWMTLHTPLTVTQRQRHSYDVFPDAGRSQPFGSGATCFYNYGDLMLRNDTAMPFKLELGLTEEHLVGAWLGAAPPDWTYEIYEKEHLIRSEIWGGYTRHNVIFRKKFDKDGNLLEDIYITENHAIMMYAPLIGAGQTH